jgi:hypothetical protein
VRRSECHCCGWASRVTHPPKHPPLPTRKQTKCETKHPSARVNLEPPTPQYRCTRISPTDMSKQYEDPDIGELHLSDSDDHLFDSPADTTTKGKIPAGANGKPRDCAPQSNKTRSGESPYDAEEARDAQLRQELENIRKINAVIEGVVESLEKAKSNMEVSHFPLTSARVATQLLIKTTSLDSQSNCQ